MSTTRERGRQLLVAVVEEGQTGRRGRPDRWGALLEPLRKWYLGASPEERAAIREGVGVREGAILRGTSLQLCAAAARAEDAQYLEQSLLCHVLEGFERDERDSARLLAVVHHVAERVGVDPARLFRDALLLAEGRARRCLQEFLDRPEEMKTLETMRMEEIVTPRGVVYREKHVPLPKWS